MCVLFMDRDNFTFTPIAFQLLMSWGEHHTQRGLMANVLTSMTVSTIKTRAMRLSFGLEDGDCKGFRNINKSVTYEECWNKIFKLKLLMFEGKISPHIEKYFQKV